MSYNGETHISAREGTAYIRQGNQNILLFETKKPRYISSSVNPLLCKCFRKLSQLSGANPSPKCLIVSLDNSLFFR